MESLSHCILCIHSHRYCRLILWLYRRHKNHALLHALLLLRCVPVCVCVCIYFIFQVHSDTSIKTEIFNKRLRKMIKLWKLSFPKTNAARQRMSRSNCITSGLVHNTHVRARTSSQQQYYLSGKQQCQLWMGSISAWLRSQCNSMPMELMLLKHGFTDKRAYRVENTRHLVQ